MRHVAAAVAGSYFAIKRQQPWDEVKARMAKGRDQKEQDP